MPTEAQVAAIEARLNRTGRTAEAARNRSLTATIATPYSTRTSGTNTSSNFATQLNAAINTSTRYTVKSGENLSQICETALRKAGRDTSSATIRDVVRSVAQDSGITNPDAVSVGQSLNLKAVTNPVFANASARAQLPEITRTPRIVSPTAITRNASVISAKSTPTVPQTQATTPAENKSTLEALAKRVVQTAQEAAAKEPAGRAEAIASLRKEFSKQVSPEQTSNLIKLVESLVTATEKSQSASSSTAEKDPLAHIVGKAAIVSSQFGTRPDPFTGKSEQHNGIDLAVGSGTTVYPVASGTVVSSGWQGTYGKTVVVRHADNTESLYAHNEQVSVKAGDKVTANTPIAKVGSTGRSTGPHLHFEVRQNDRAIDPVAYLAKLETTPTKQKEHAPQLASASRSSLQITKTL